MTRRLRIAFARLAALSMIALAIGALDDLAASDEIGWPPVEQTEQLGGLRSTESSNDNREISGSCWNEVDRSLWVVQSNPQMAFRIRFEDDRISRSTASVTSHEISQWEINQAMGTTGVDYGDLEACAVLDPGNIDELYVLSENAGAIIGIDGLDGSDGPRTYRVWNLEGPDIHGTPGMPPEPKAAADGYGKGTGAEALEFLRSDTEIGFREVRSEAGQLIGMETNLSLRTIQNGVEQERLWLRHNFGTDDDVQLGQLALVGHQRDGRLYVFEINPFASGEFINHGYYLTGANEICGLHWDVGPAELYIWHGEELPNPNHRGERNSLEIWHLDRELDGETGQIDGDQGSWRTWRTIGHFKEDVPGNTEDPGYTTNYESIALVPENGKFGASPWERAMFLVKDDEEATGASTPIRWFLLPHSTMVDLDGDGNVDERDEEIMLKGIADGDMRFDVNRDGRVDDADFREVFAQELLEVVEEAQEEIVESTGGTGSD